MKNHQTQPAGSTPFLEANGVLFPKAIKKSFHKRNFDRRRGKRRGRGMFKKGSNHPK